MKILCIIPRFVIKGGFYEFPLGMGYISAALKKKGYETFGLNLCESSRSIPELIKEKIKKYKIDVVCTGGLVTYFHSIKEIVETAKSAKKNIITIVGGGLVTCEPELVMKNLNFSFGITGEGEETICELLSCIENEGDLRSISGIVFKDENGVIRKTADRAPIMKLDSIPFVDFDGFEIGKYLEHLRTNDIYYLHMLDNPRALPIISSRSCPFKCDFCYHPLGTKYRKRSLDNFFGEVELMIEKYHINILAVLDELLSADLERLAEFCKRIKKYKLQWMTQLRVHPVNEDMLKMMKDSGCSYLSVGLESINNDVLKSMRKNINAAHIENTLRLMRKIGIGIQGNFIFGDRAETMETFRETIKWWKAHSQYSINLSPLVPYPKSELYVEAVQKGIINPEKYIKAACPVVNISGMAPKEYRKMLEQIDELRVSEKYYVAPKYMNVKRRRTDPLKGPLWDIEFKCVFCGEMNYIRDYNIQGTRSYERLLAIHCRKCNSKHVFQDEKIEPFVQPETIKRKVNRLAEEWKKKALRICVYGAGRHTRDIMNWTSLPDADIAGIIDDSEAMRGKIIGGVKVYLPNEIGFLKPELILISSSLAEKEIYLKIKHLKDWGIQIFTLYKNYGDRKNAGPTKTSEHR